VEDRKSVDVELFKQGMRQLVGAVTLITTQDATQRRGMTATAVCSLSAEPPSLLVCINRSAEAHDVILSGRCFCMSVLAYRHQSLAECFAGRDGSKGEERFERGSWGVLATGAPYLEDSLAAFDCALADTHELVTHTIFIGRVVAVHRIAGEPLLYEGGHFKRLDPAIGPRALKTELFEGEHTESIMF
jgi:flavin reductase (DIM6/NTAB) family NADH-FMN oxidoreductase RutF